MGGNLYILIILIDNDTELSISLYKVTDAPRLNLLSDIAR